VENRFQSLPFKCNLQRYTEDVLDYIEWASSEPRIVGFAPYHWNNCPYCRRTRNEIGVKEMNSTRLTWWGSAR
jgi:hypothetical protein